MLTSRSFRLTSHSIMLLIWAAYACGAWGKPFVIAVVDEQTHRGVPLVELTTVNNLRFITDSNGLVAFDEPGFMNQRVFFNVSSQGYEFPTDGFGIRGAALEVKPGGRATLQIKRLNIAQRLYRITGEGIYRDTVLAGEKAPLKQPLLNAQVLGQDSVQRVIYRGKIHWFWGDTSRAAYPLGHFGMAGAVSELPPPAGNGLDPSVGIDLEYFVDRNGFSRPMFPGENLRWADGFMVVRDAEGEERLIAKCDTLKSLSQRLGRKLTIYNDEKNSFDDLKQLDRDEPLCPSGHPFRFTDKGTEYFYFPSPYPVLRVKADIESIKVPSEYEGFTCLAAGARFANRDTKLDRDASGKLVWSWKKNTPPLSYQEQTQLIKSGLFQAEEAWYQLRDVDSKNTVIAHSGSVAWNEYRKKWMMIAVQTFGKESFLGEVWFSEADQPQGPFRWAKKIVTHDHYSFYNPAHHPFFDQQGGKIIYFEGTYSFTFSRNDNPTPRYDYNQIMYQLDLSDPRLKLPEK